MPDFSSIENPTVQDRLSYWGGQVGLSMDNGNAFMPQNLIAAWMHNHIKVSIEFAKAQDDARSGVGELSLNIDDPGNVLYSLLREQELINRSKKTLDEQTPESLRLLNEVRVAERSCFNERSWD